MPTLKAGPSEKDFNKSENSTRFIKIINNSEIIYKFE